MFAPVQRRCTVYAAHAPLPGGGTGPFELVAEYAQHLVENHLGNGDFDVPFTGHRQDV